MSDSTDNTTELDSYGVWVKRPGSTEDTSSDSLDIDAAFDIPDFAEDEITIDETPAEEIEMPEVSSDDIDLSSFDIPVEEDIPADEILPEETEISEESDSFIDDSEIKIEENSEQSEESMEDISNEISFGDFDIATEEMPVMEETAVEEPSIEITEPSTEEIATEEIRTEEISMDDFELPQEDGEISLDEFMDEGFSDESVASGNNGFAPGNGPVVTEDVSADFMEDGEISLDDFLDGGDFSPSPAQEAKPQVEDIVDEKPLEMEISFDNDVDTIETEDNIQTDETFDDEDSFVSEYETTSFISDGASHSTEIFGDTEEIDLSDFGIDADAEETPITQNVEESKMKDTVVDFDLSVSDEKFASAPMVTEIKDEKPETEAVVETPVIQESVTEAPAPQAPVSNTSNDLLQQIINELSGMKAEINELKSNLEQIQNQKAETHVQEEETVIPETSDDTSTGFFDETDGDDTISLSGDELDNMLNNVELSESEEEPEVEENEIIAEENEPVIEETAVEEPVTEEETVIIEENEPVIEETAVDEPVIEETVTTEEPVTDDIEIPETSNDDSAGFFDETDGDDTIALSDDELDNMLSNVELNESEEEPVIEETTMEEPVVDEISDEPSVEQSIETEDVSDIPEEIDIEPVSTETVDDDIFGSVEDTFGAEESEEIEINEEEAVPESDDVMEEPDLDNIIIEDELSENEDLPEEISIPKVDDILVESANNDFMDSVTDSTEENEKVDDFEDFMNSDLSAEDSLTESNIDYLSEEEVSDTVEEDSIDQFPTVEETFGESEDNSADNEEVSVEDESIAEEKNEPVVEEPVIEDTISEEEEPVIQEPTVSEEEPVIEDTVIEEEEPVIEETSVEESEVEVPAEEEMTVSRPHEEPVKASTEDSSDDLKKDIKSVLLYMDQLLENLPEEKIVEFAKSDEFTTYKKLFSELGLA